MFLFSFVDDDPVELQRWLDVRRDLYLESGLITSQDLGEDGNYVDQYELASAHIVMSDGAGDPIGSCRLIDGRRSPLQVANQFGVVPSADAIEVSGFAVANRRRISLVTIGCYWLIVDFARSNGYDEIHFEIEPWLQRTLVRVGFPIEQTGEPQHVYNAINVPFRVNVADIVPALRAKDADRTGPSLGDLFDAPFTGLFDPAALRPNTAAPFEPAA